MVTRAACSARLEPLTGLELCPHCETGQRHRPGFLCSNVEELSTVQSSSEQRWRGPLLPLWFPHTAPALTQWLTLEFPTTCKLGATRKEGRESVLFSSERTLAQVHTEFLCPISAVISEGAWHNHPQGPAAFPVAPPTVWRSRPHSASILLLLSQPHASWWCLWPWSVPGQGTTCTVLPNHSHIPTPFFTGAKSPRIVQS